MSEKPSLLTLMQTKDPAITHSPDHADTLTLKIQEFANNISQLHPSVRAWVQMNGQRRSGNLFLSPKYREQQQHQPVLSFHTNGTAKKPVWAIGGKEYTSIPKLEKGLAKLYQSEAFQNTLAYYHDLSEEPVTALLTGTRVSNALTVNDQLCEIEGEPFHRLASLPSGAPITILVSLRPLPPGVSSHWESSPLDQPPAPYLRALGHTMRVKTFLRKDADPAAPGFLILELTGQVLDHPLAPSVDLFSDDFDLPSATA